MGFAFPVLPPRLPDNDLLSRVGRSGTQFVCDAIVDQQAFLAATGASPRNIIAYRHDAAFAGAISVWQSAQFRADAVADHVFFVGVIAGHAGTSLAC